MKALLDAILSPLYSVTEKILSKLPGSLSYLDAEALTSNNPNFVSKQIWEWAFYTLLLTILANAIVVWTIDIHDFSLFGFEIPKFWPLEVIGFIMMSVYIGGSAGVVSFALYQGMLSLLQLVLSTAQVGIEPLTISAEILKYVDLGSLSITALFYATLYYLIISIAIYTDKAEIWLTAIAILIASSLHLSMFDGDGWITVPYRNGLAFLLITAYYVHFVDKKQCFSKTQKDKVISLLKEEGYSSLTDFNKKLLQQEELVNDATLGYNSATNHVAVVKPQFHQAKTSLEEAQEKYEPFKEYFAKHGIMEVVRKAQQKDAIARNALDAQNALKKAQDVYKAESDEVTRNSVQTVNTCKTVMTKESEKLEEMKVLKTEIQAVLA